jgi:hypothetical protein
MHPAAKYEDWIDAWQGQSVPHQQQLLMRLRMQQKPSSASDNSVNCMALCEQASMLLPS